MSTTLAFHPVASPVVKWSGGKRQILARLMALQPPRWKRYLEPFAGGAALFFALGAPGSYLSDTNGELINMYEVLREHPEPLIAHLSRHKNEEDYYYQARALDPTSLSPLERASRFLYLLRVCYNGLWRENSSGKMNTPFGCYRNPDIVQEALLRGAHGVLQSATIVKADFKAVLTVAQPGDWVYCDPPYAPVSKTANFTSYTRLGFGWSDQEMLAEAIRSLARQGVHVMASNADVPEIHELYKGLDIRVVPVRRAINSNAAKRRGATEVIITTYPVDQ